MQQRLGLRDAAHLLQRTGIGSDPHVAQKLASLSRSDAIESIIEGMHKQSSLPMPLWVNQNAPPFWARSDMSRADRRAFNRARNREISELRRWWVAEMISTPSPQTERLVLLWHNHFVSAYSGVDQESTSIARQNQMFRESGLDNFRSLLKAVIRDPAMLNYLDNRSNKKKSPNENLARELLELFTMGEGEFDERTVKEAARALTGWTVSVPKDMSFSIAYWDQDKDIKTLFGKSGVFDGDDLIDLILEQPATAKHIARVFWRNFVSEFSVDENVIADLANTFRSSNYELKALYRAVLESPAFWADEYRGHIVKSPVDLLIGTIRSTGVVPKRWQVIPAELDKLGQTLFDPPNVAGWAGGRAWITPDRLLSRRTALKNLFRPALFKHGGQRSNNFQNDGQASTQSANQSNSAMTMDANSTSTNNSGMMMSESLSMAGGTMSSDMMAGANTGMDNNAMVMETTLAQSPERSDGGSSALADLSLSIASEDFQGAPKAKVVLIDKSATVWDSGEFLLPSGHDTERLGRLNNDDVIAWQRIDFSLPDSVSNIETIEVHFLNDMAGAAGDRNLFVDMVTLRGESYLARTGTQKSRCPPKHPEDAGILYCAGKVVIPTDRVQSVPIVSVSTRSVESRQQMIIADAYMHWVQGLKPGSERRQMSLGLKNVQLGQRRWDTLVFDLVSSRDLGPGLEISSDGCLADCFIEWPECAWKNDINVTARTVFFPLNRSQVGLDIHCHWDSLGKQDKQLVGSLFLLLPDIMAAVSEGRKAQRRPELFAGWSSVVEAELAKLDAIYQVDNAAIELVITGYDASSSSPPQLFERPKAAERNPGSTLGVLRQLLASGGEQWPALLAIAPVNQLTNVDVIPTVFSDPAYQVR